jgi:hypothetical protein
MKQVLVRKGRVMVEDVPAPLVGMGNVLVEVAYSLISTGTEVEGVSSPWSLWSERRFNASQTRTDKKPS